MNNGSTAGFGAVGASLLMNGVLFIPVSRWTLQLVEWVHGAGLVGVTVYVAVYIAATLFVLPGSVLTAGAGFAYGPGLGLLIVSPLSVLAATLAFLLGRYVARDWVSRKLSKRARLEQLDRALADNGFKLVLLLRLSPIVPFNVLNYALGLTRVRLRDYVLASWIGMLPGTFLYVYMGSVVTNASELLSRKPQSPTIGPWAQALYWGGLLATLVVTIVITRIANRALKHTLDADAGAKPKQAQS